MKKRLRGFKRSVIHLDFDLYRVEVPIPGVVGDKLSVIDIRPEGVERTLVFVHGYLGCAETWEHQIEHFARSYRVVAPDLRGHGQSDAPYSQYTMAELVADLYAITQALRLPPRFVLVGHSFGGSICVEYAVAHPEQIERLILIATAGQYPLPRLLSLIYRLPTSFFRLWWDYRPRWNAEVHAFKRMMTNNLRHWQGWTLLERIQAPTLVITGERDNYFPRWVYEKVGSTIPGAEVVDIGASKHKVQLERHRAVNRAIERFLGDDRQAGSWRGQTASSAASDLLARRPWLSAYPPGIPRTVPIPSRPLPDFLAGAAAALPRQTATRFFGARLTYQQLDRKVNQFAHVVHGLGLRLGERVMIVLPNMPEFLIAYYGTLRAGGVVVLPNPDADAEQIAREAAEAQAVMLVTLAECGRLIAAVRRRAPMREVLLVESPADALGPEAHALFLRQWTFAVGPAAEEALGSGRSLAALLRDAPFDPPPTTVTDRDLAAILFTSGTSSLPKGVGLTHANLVANTMQTRHWFPDLQYGGETFLAALPLRHSYGMTTAMNLPIAVAATIVLLPLIDLRLLLEHVRTYRPTIFPAVPSLYAAINHAANVREYGLGSIKACLSGAAPLPVEVQETFEKLTRGRLVEGYGLTEASPVTHANPLVGTRKSGSIGVPLPNTDARIVDPDTGAELPPGEVGELAVRGPQVMRGYCTAGAESGDTRLRDGWLFTGDLAIMDTDGYFHLIGRKSEVIPLGERRIYPRDIEEILYEHSKVQEAAVVGVPDGAGGWRIKAFVVPRPGAAPSKDELLNLCRRRLDPEAVPWDIEFRQELPKNFLGKVLRRLLVESGSE